MHIASLHTYPVKGSRRLELDAAVVEPWGLAGDRRWMMIDADGVGITQRDASVMTQLTVRPRPGGLVLSAPGRPDLDVDEPVDGAKVSVRVFSDKEAVPARLAETDWSSAFLGRDARLVWQADPTGRAVERPSLDGDRVSFADGYPLLLATTASLDALNDWLAEAGEEPVPMTRFRPNLVVAGATAWAEDDWIGHRVLAGEVTFRVTSACPRCVVTTIDQETGVKQRQPLRILGLRRRFEKELRFAVNLVPDVAAGATGVVRVGDPVVALP